jgi:2-amino-4-hydroxy-6-hydroxymethyldihydropteridine diphosphokinase
VIAPDLRGVGEQGLAPEGFGDAATHSADLYALLHGALRIERVCVVAGGLGGAVAHDLSLRFPGFVERLVLFNCPLPHGQQEAPNPTPALLLFGLEDRDVPLDWDVRAARAFPDHLGPLRLPGTGRRVQWEAAPLFDGAIARLLGPTPRVAWADAEIAYVALGSNLGPRERHLCAAVAALRATPGVRDAVVSPVYETRPLGPGEQGAYLNAVARLETRLSPRALLERLLEIERSEGRLRGPELHAPRTLDLDLLLHGSRRCDEPGLQLPHPRLHERAFVLEPLRDLAPQLLHPLLGLAIEALAERVRDPSGVRRRDLPSAVRR